MASYHRPTDAKTRGRKHQNTFGRVCDLRKAVDAAVVRTGAQGRVWKTSDTFPKNFLAIRGKG
jgi:hypothetical protein